MTLGSTPGLGDLVETVTTDDLIDILFASFGETGGLQAFVYALERGYSVAQVQAAIAEERLRGPGIINGTKPANSALGLIELPNDPEAAGGFESVGFVFADTPIGFDSFFDLAVVWLSMIKDYEGGYDDSNAKRLIRVIVGLNDQGYSERQILEAIFLRQSLDVVTSEGFPVCAVLRDNGGTLVIPDEPPCRDIVTEAWAEEGAQADLEGFVGDFDTQPIKDAWPACAVDIVRNQVVIHVDTAAIGGRLELIYNGPAALIYDRNPDEPDTCVVTCVAPVTVLSNHDLRTGSWDFDGTQLTGAFDVQLKQGPGTDQACTQPDDKGRTPNDRGVYDVVGQANLEAEIFPYAEGKFKMDGKVTISTTGQVFKFSAVLED